MITPFYFIVTYNLRMCMQDLLFLIFQRCCRYRLFYDTMQKKIYYGSYIEPFGVPDASIGVKPVLNP